MSGRTALARLIRSVFQVLVLSLSSIDTFAARDWQASCGYEDCASGNSWTGLIIWTAFLVAGLIGAAREGWQTFSLAIVWLLLVAITLYGWLAWGWHWLPFIIVVSALWWWPNAKGLVRSGRDETAP